jgi:hypothetical protein
LNGGSSRSTGHHGYICGLCNAWSATHTARRSLSKAHATSAKWSHRLVSGLSPITELLAHIVDAHSWVKLESTSGSCAESFSNLLCHHGLFSLLVDKVLLENCVVVGWCSRCHFRSHSRLKSTIGIKGCEILHPVHSLSLLALLKERHSLLNVHINLLHVCA